MCYSQRSSFRQQLSVLKRQFLQDGELPLANVLSEESVSQALQSIESCWKNRIYSPLVTLSVFLGQVLSADHSCRAAVARLIAHRLSHGQSPSVQRKQERTAKSESDFRKSFSQELLAELVAICRRRVKLNGFGRTGEFSFTMEQPSPCPIRQRIRRPIRRILVKDQV